MRSNELDHIVSKYKFGCCSGLAYRQTSQDPAVPNGAAHTEFFAHIARTAENADWKPAKSKWKAFFWFLILTMVVWKRIFYVHLGPSQVLGVHGKYQEPRGCQSARFHFFTRREKAVSVMLRDRRRASERLRPGYGRYH